MEKISPLFSGKQHAFMEGTFAETPFFFSKNDHFPPKISRLNTVVTTTHSSIGSLNVIVPAQRLQCCNKSASADGISLKYVLLDFFRQKSKEPKIFQFY